jgi:hypothetical protein
VLQAAVTAFAGGEDVEVLLLGQRDVPDCGKHERFKMKVPAGISAAIKVEVNQSYAKCLQNRPGRGPVLLKIIGNLAPFKESEFHSAAILVI